MYTYTTYSKLTLDALIAFLIYLYQKGWGSGGSGSLAGFSALSIATALQLKKIRAEISQPTGGL